MPPELQGHRGSTAYNGAHTVLKEYCWKLTYARPLKGLIYFEFIASRATGMKVRSKAGQFVIDHIALFVNPKNSTPEITCLANFNKSFCYKWLQCK